MQCCTQSQSNKENGAIQKQQHSCGGGLKTMLMMLVCCLAPLGAVLLLRQSGYDVAASYLMLLLCPLIHLFMMRGMHKHQEPANKDNTVK